MSATAAFDKASLDLGFTRLTSPIDGIAGMAKAQIGNLVGPGQIEELTTVSTVNPIKAYAGLSEQEYLKAPGNEETTGRKNTAGTYPRRRQRLSPERAICFCGQAGGCADGDDQGRELHSPTRISCSGRASSHVSGHRWESRRMPFSFPSGR